MTKRMLIDATHAEETRVVVLDGNRLEDFDVETSTKKQLKGNIYLAKVVRVEPSLQAAFVEYGGGRHGFLAFGEIHPDYYQIPVADRERLLALQAEEARAEEEEEDDEPAPTPEPARRESGRGRGRDRKPAEPVAEAQGLEVPYGAVTYGEVAETDIGAPPAEPEALSGEIVEYGEVTEAEPDEDGQIEAPAPEVIGGENDTFEGNGADEARRRRAARFLRNYRIQEVIRRRQILLIQVVKEERGTKGAALTTYISLAGRYCVLMPNSPRGGGISRKITSSADRRRLKEITAELEIPQGMGLIVRTAGAARPKPEIKRDCEYLMRLWDDIRELTMRSMAPALIYEEASLIKRAIRDGYSRDIDEVLVDGEAGWKAAHDFMRMLMPSHAKKVQLWRPGANGGSPLFTKYAVDQQLDAMMSPNVQLKSGGYLVINQAEALVAIDVNSGRSTRERGIEETALRTNLEAAEEVARQLRLRDLAGLIVIDFIDMESKKHNTMVERRLKEALKDDRARIQVGFISHFGLLEMSRQRLRPSLAETSFVTCPHCNGLGHVRSIESSAIHILRAVEDEAAKGRASLITLHAATPVVLYLLNHKRERLIEIEARTGMRTNVATDDSLVPPAIRIDREKAAVPLSERPLPVAPAAPVFEAGSDDDEDADVVITEDGEAAEPASEDQGARGNNGDEAERRRKRRRRRRGGRRDDGAPNMGDDGAPNMGEDGAPNMGEDGAPNMGEDAEPGEDAPAAVGETVAEAVPEAVPPAVTDDEPALPAVAEDVAQQGDMLAALAAASETEAEGEKSESPTDELDENGEVKPRRRGRRGGRRRRKDDTAGETTGEAVAAEAPPPPAPVVAPPPPPPPVYVAPVYTGPTPADPFGGRGFDIFDIMDQVERQEEAKPIPAPKRAKAAPPAPAEPVDVKPEPVEVKPEPVALKPEPVAPPAPEPVAETAAEAVPGPVIQPIIIGDGPLPVATPKKGWWRR